MLARFATFLAPARGSRRLGRAGTALGALAIAAVLAPLAWTGSARPADAGRAGPAPTTTTMAGSSASFDVRQLPQLPANAHPSRDSLEEREAPQGGGLLAGDLAAIGAGTTAEAPAPAVGQSFEGLAFGDDCGGTQCGNGHPPDTNGDVGPTYYIETINTAIGIYNKSTGSRVAAFSFDAFMSQGAFGNLCDTDNYGDPVVLYDTFSDRWVITDFAFQVDGAGNVVNPPGSYQCIAVSRSGDPVSGGWNFYSLHLTDGLQDYPKLGIWPDGIYMSANVFGFAANGSFQTARVWALDKAAMYGGQAAQAVSFNVARVQGQPPFSLLPSNARAQAGTPPSGRPNLFTAIHGFTDRIRVWQLHVDWGNTSSSTFTGPVDSMTGSTWSVPPTTVPAKNGNDLDTLGYRLMAQNQYSNVGGVESLWDSHTVAGGSSTQAAVRWYQVPVTGGTVGGALQASTYNPDAKNRWMSSVAVDRRGDMAIGYSVSDAATNPAIRYAGRLVGDSPGQVTQTEQVLINGTGSQVGNCGGAACERWGDYSAMTLDPDGCTFWYTNEYYAVDGLNHHTRIGSFRYQSCVDSPPPTVPPPTATPVPTTTPTATPAPTPVPTATASPVPTATAGASVPPDLTPPTVMNVQLGQTSVIPGATVTVTATATDSGGVAGAEKQLAGGAWSAMAATDGAFDEATEAVTSTVTAPSVAGAYQVCIRATDTHGNTSSGTTCATLTVMTFSLSASPATLSVRQGAAGSSTITIARSSFSAPVDLSATGLPLGTVATFSADPTTGTSSTLTLQTSNCGTVTPRGTYTISISGTAVGLTRTTAVGLTVTNAPPKVTAPSSTLYANTTLGSSTVRVKTAWSACDPDGVLSYQLQRQVNGGSWANVTLSSPTATSIAQSLTRGTTYRFRVRATDKASLTSSYAYGPSFVPRVSDQTSSALAYVGTWGTSSSTSYWGGSIRHATSSTATATYVFSGSSVAWVAYKGSTRGSARVYIDNVLVATVSLYATSSTARAQVFARSWSTEGPHSIRVEVVGTAGHPRVDVDAMVRLDLV